jgi:hypothetical protein
VLRITAVSLDYKDSKSAAGSALSQTEKKSKK